MRFSTSPSEPFLGHAYWIDRLVRAIENPSGTSDYLRTAQKLAEAGIHNSLKEKQHRKFLVDMPTQSGKTPLYVHLLQLLADHGTMPRVLLIAPYRNLVNQLRQEFVKFGKHYPKGHPLADIGVWHALEKKLGQITATTWASAGIMVRDGIINPKEIDFVFVDEAHLGQTAIRKNLLAMFDNAVIGAFTATPAYSDEKDLEKEFALAFRMTVQEAVDKKVISQFRSVILEDEPIDLSGIPLKGDDYDRDALQALVSTEARTQNWISFYRDWVDPISGQAMLGKKGYINTVSIDRANKLSARFNTELGHLMPEGVQVAAAIHSDMSPKEQRDVFERYKTGKIKLLVQIRLAGLGLSQPDAEICINDAPSISPVEVEQRAGRVVAIDENNPNKCAYIVERADFGRGAKQPLLYGEVVGAGVGYKKSATLNPPQNKSRRERKIISDPAEVAAFVAQRIKLRVAARLEAAYNTPYVKLKRAAARKNIYTLSELWSKVQQQYIGLFPGQPLPGKAIFDKFIEGKINPWDDRKLFTRYSHLAVAAAAVAGLHPRHVFGSPEELLKKFGKPFDKPTAQRLHIQKLMREAVNPLVGRKGISSADLRTLSSFKIMDRSSHSIFFDSEDAAGKSRQVIKSFYHHNSKDGEYSAGEASEWALDLATILDKSVEEVFRDDAALIGRQATRKRKKGAEEEGSEVVGEKIDEAEYVSSLPYSLPLDQPARLKAAVHLSREAQYGDEDLDEVVASHQLSETLNAYLRRLSPREERVIRMRYGIKSKEYGLDEIAAVHGLSSERIRQIEVKALRRLLGMNTGAVSDDRLRLLTDAIGYTEQPEDKPKKDETFSIKAPAFEHPGETIKHIRERLPLLEDIRYMSNGEAIRHLAVVAKTIPDINKNYFILFSLKLQSGIKEKERAEARVAILNQLKSHSLASSSKSDALDFLNKLDVAEGDKEYFSKLKDQIAECKEESDSIYSRYGDSRTPLQHTIDASLTQLNWEIVRQVEVKQYGNYYVGEAIKKINERIATLVSAMEYFKSAGKTLLADETQPIEGQAGETEEKNIIYTFKSKSKNKKDTASPVPLRVQRLKPLSAFIFIKAKPKTAENG